MLNVIHLCIVVLQNLKEMNQPKSNKNIHKTLDHQILTSIVTSVIVAMTLVS